MSKDIKEKILAGEEIDWYNGLISKKEQMSIRQEIAKVYNLDPNIIIKDEMSDDDPYGFECLIDECEKVRTIGEVHYDLMYELEMCSVTQDSPHEFNISFNVDLSSAKKMRTDQLEYYPAHFLNSAYPVEGELKEYPHKCPHCGAPAYVGMNDVDCKNMCDFWGAR